MNIFILFISSGISLVLLMIHSYLFRGKRITLNFFIFAFITAFLKEGAVRKENIFEPYPYLKPYGFTDRIPVFFASLIATIGWVFTFYISWCIAERILRRLDYFKNRIFATLLLSSLAIIAISYCIEVTAMNIGWWVWRNSPMVYRHMFIGGYYLLFLCIWLFFCLPFLTTFFLIECSKYRKSRWKSLFLFIPFIYVWAAVYFSFMISPGKLELPVIILACFTFLLLSFLAFFYQLPFEYGNIDYDNEYIKNKHVSSFLRNIPVLVLLLMISITVIADFSIINKPILIISAVPLLFLQALSIKRLQLHSIIMIALLIIFLDELRLRSLFTITPVIVFLIMWVFSRSKERNMLQ